jgi:hypothetical protein
MAGMNKVCQMSDTSANEIWGDASELQLTFRKRSTPILEPSSLPAAFGAG